MRHTPATPRADAARAGAVPADTPARAALDRIFAHDRDLHAFAQLRPEAAGESADGARRGADGAGATLVGVPVAVKDSIAVAGLPQAAGRAPAGLPRAPHDATVVARLRAAGAVVVGTTNMSELAAAALSVNRAHGTVRNPRDRGRHAGGSSGGSAAAVAAGLVPLTLGTDTSGSVILPAALCGVAGLRPTHGRISLDGVIGLAPTLDTVGPIAATAAELATVFPLLADPPRPARWKSGVSRGHRTSIAARADALPGLRVGLLGGWFSQTLDPGVADALERVVAAFADAGAAVRPLELPGAADARAAGRTIYLREAAASFAALTGSAPPPAGAAPADAPADLRATLPPGVAERLEAGAAIGDDELAAARATRERWRGELRDAFARHDLLLCATSPLPAPPLDAELEATGRALLHNTYPICLGGVPALTLPAGPGAEGLPAGALLIAPWDGDERLLALGAALEDHLNHPGDDDGIR